MSAQRRSVHLKRPLQTAHGTLRERELIAVTLIDEDGVEGHGEAAPLETYDGVSIARVESALARYERVLADAREMNGVQLIEACRRVEDLPQALAAIDMALWDRAGIRAGKPVAELLTDDPVSEVAVNATIGATDRQGAVDQAAEAVEEGFECIKVKVGTGDDTARVAAVRATAGPRTALRLDANGAWTVEEAIRMIDALAPIGLELVEEPTHGLRGVREVRERVSTRVAIDETAAEHGALGAGVADAVCLKIGRCGGISGLLAAATLVRASGAEAYVSSTLDGPLGIAAGLHAAAALASRGPVPACGLATLRMFEGAIEEDVLPVRSGRIALLSAAGLGVGPL
ncbi:MAG: mandelate racemase/muconate lactonizing enzyme family protein [Solirubrobacteraceae bacterium]